MPSTIEWTDETWNPVTGCSRVSPGCDNCYMFALYPRLKAMGVPGYADAPDKVQALPERLRVPSTWKRPRLTVLGRIPARIRFVSAEPLLGALDLSEWLSDGTLHWVIAGGESGLKARAMDLDWARNLRDQCADMGTPFFLKQLGGRRGKRSGHEAELDGIIWTDVPTWSEIDYAAD